MATLSIGMVFKRDAPLDLTELLVQADQALYVAKERCRNRLEIASREQIQKRRDTLAERMAAVAAARSAAWPGNDINKGLGYDASGKSRHRELACSAAPSAF